MMKIEPTRRQLLRALCLGGAAAATTSLVGCGGEGAESGSGAAAAGDPVQGGDLVIALSYEPDTLNVYATHLMGDVQAFAVEGLLVPNEHMEYIPVLAQEVPTVENGLIYAKSRGWNTRVKSIIEGASFYAKSYINNNQNTQYLKKFNVMNLHGDVMWNISNAIGGYKETRTWNFVPYVGFGWARSAANHLYNNEFAFTYGLLNNIRLGNLVDLNLEVKQMVVNQGFDQVVRGAKSEGMFTVTAGLTFKLNRRGFNRPTVAVPADYTPYNNKIASLEDELAKSKAEAKRLADELAAEKNKVKEAPAAAPAIEGPIMGTFFNIGSYTITPQEIMNLGYVANYIKAYPNKKFTIVGYADSATGSAKRNQYLSQQRADAVCKVLVDRFGVDASQLEVVAKGGTDKFPEIPLNRVAIVESNK